MDIGHFYGYNSGFADVLRIPRTLHMSLTESPSSKRRTGIQALRSGDTMRGMPRKDSHEGLLIAGLCRHCYKVRCVRGKNVIPHTHESGCK